jgi:hypothetical protein
MAVFSWTADCRKQVWYIVNEQWQGFQDSKGSGRTAMTRGGSSRASPPHGMAELRHDCAVLLQVIREPVPSEVGWCLLAERRPSVLTPGACFRLAV